MHTCTYTYTYIFPPKTQYDGGRIWRYKCICLSYHTVGGAEGRHYPSVQVINPIAYQDIIISKEFHIDFKFPAFEKPAGVGIAHLKFFVVYALRSFPFTREKFIPKSLVYIHKIYYFTYIQAIFSVTNSD